MTATDDLAEGLAAVHAEAFATPWPASAFTDLLGQPGVVLEGDADGFILIRAVADEAELLTLAVRPAARRQGLGARLVRVATDRAKALGVTLMFLEVAEDNAPARALYESLGFESAGRRPRYYPRAEGRAADALLLVRNFA